MLQVRGANAYLGNRRRPVADNVTEAALAAVEENPGTSTRRVSGQLGAAHSTIWKIWRAHGLHPFHKQKVQGLNPEDYQPRSNFCEWYLQRCQQEEVFPFTILFSDEATFGRDGIFNTKNNVEWSDENPHSTYGSGHQVQFSVNVWLGVVGDELIGPYLLPARLNSENYLIFLQEVLPGLLENVPLPIRREMIFQQDGAPAHFGRFVRAHLNETFPLRWIGRAAANDLVLARWPARSPDLNPLDFCLWGWMKALVYETPVDLEEDLIARILAAALVIQETPEIFANIRESMHKRCTTCIQANGAHFEQLL